MIFPENVADFWTEERRKAEGPDAPAIDLDRVHDFSRWSKRTPKDKKIPNRYEDNPIPYPRATRGRRQPGWDDDQEQDLRDWWHDRLSTAPDDPGRAARIAARKADWDRDSRNINN